MSEEADTAILADEISGGFKGLITYVSMPDGSVQKLLAGYPLHVVEYGSPVGDFGDVLLADCSQYQLVSDGREPTRAISMEVRYVENEGAFRFVLRVNGRPLWHEAKLPYKGTITKSPYVALAERA